MENSITPFVPQNLGQASELAETLSKSKLLPVDLRGNKSDVLVQIITGSELGLGPMQSIRSIHIIQGKPTMSADLMVALVKRSPECVSFKIVESDGQHAIYETERKGEGMTRIGFTLQEAKDAGLIKDGSGWKKYPAAMLRARAASALCRAVYPDLLLGVYETSELDDIRGNVRVEQHAATGSDNAQRLIPCEKCGTHTVQRDERGFALCAQCKQEPVPSSFDCSPLLSAIEAAPTTDALKALVPQLTTVPADAKATLRSAYNARQFALNASEQAAEESNG